MGKDLHYSILPFIKNALNRHINVAAIFPIDDPDFYIFKIVRTGAFDDIYLVLSDDYHFGDYNYISKHPILKDGGFILIARPEANDYDINEPGNQIGVGKIGKLLGALNRNDFWNYITPPKKYQ
jgi:hypothetical protein